MNALAQKIVDRLSARMTERVEKYSAASLKRDVKSAASETDTSPTDAQKEAGNYRKGRFSWNGLSIVIENPAGSVRSGKSKSGHEWSIRMPIHYGYIARTESKADGDAIDVFVGPHPESDIVFVVDQQRVDGGQFDEHKVIIGYFTSQAAKDAYQSCYSSGWKGLKSLTPMTVDQFKAWLDEGSSEHPIAGQVSKYAKNRVASGQLGFGFKEDAGQKSFKWKEELHPRDAEGKFATEENKGQKVEDPENQAQVEKPEAEAQPEELNQSNYAAKMAEKAKEKLAAGGKLVHATHTSFSEYTDPSQIKESGGQLLVMQRGKWVGIPVMNTGMLAKQLDMPNYIDTPPTAEKQAEMDRMAEEAEKQSIESDRQAEEYEGFVNTHFGGSFANASTAREAAGFSDDQNAEWMKSSTPKTKEVHPEDALEFSRSRHGETPDKYAFREEDHPRNKIGEFADSESGGSQSQSAQPDQSPHHKVAASVSAGVAKLFSSTQPERKQQVTQAAVKARTANVDRRGERYGSLGTIIGVSPNGTLMVAYDSATTKDGKTGSAGTFEEQVARFDKRFKLGQFTKKPKAAKAKPPEKYSFNEQDHPRDESGQFTDKDGGSSPSFAEQASQYFADDVNGKETEGPKTYDDMLYDAQQEFDFAEQDYDYAADTFQQLDKVATSKASKAQKLRERAKAKAERAARATAAEKAARNRMDAAYAALSDAFNKAQELLKIAQADDATDVQVKASDDADELVEKLDKEYDAAEAAWDRAFDVEQQAHEAADEAEAEADNADDEAEESRKEADEAKAEVAELASAMEEARQKLAEVQGSGVQRYSADKDGDHWITIGGSDDGDRKHAGGTPVKIDKSGKIVAGPDALAGKKVNELAVKKNETAEMADESESGRPKSSADRTVRPAKRRVFSVALVKGSKPSDLCRIEHEKPFDGSSPKDPRKPFGDSFRVLTLSEAAAIINADVAAGVGASPITEYVSKI